MFRPFVKDADGLVCINRTFLYSFSLASSPPSLHISVESPHIWNIIESSESSE